MKKKPPKKPSWKDKLDPAFDKIIKFYIQFVEFVGLPANTGWVGLEDEALKLWEKKGMQGWIKRYETNMTTEKNTIIKWKIPRGVTEQERGSLTRKRECYTLSMQNQKAFVGNRVGSGHVKVSL